MTELKKRLSHRQSRRLKTLRKNKSKSAISADARRAGKLSSGKYNSETARIANDKRWAEHRRLKAEQAEKQGE